MDIIIDTKGDSGLINKDQLLDNDNDYDEEIKTIDVDLTRIFDAKYLGIEKKEQPKRKKFSSSKDFDLEKFEIDMGWKSKKVTFDLTEELADIRKDINPVDKILEKSVIKSDFERLHVVPPYELSKRQLEIHKRREKRKMGTGAEWFNMHAPEITPEIRHDLEVLRMRSALNPKHFYKKNDMKALPTHFHVGKVIDSPMDFYSSRLTKKERKKTIVDELMADAEFTKYNKRKYKEIIEEKQKTHYKAHKHARRLKRKKKK
ncbi:PREDICTED: deoxynucleotidyltransferase terminal-interacting protein 2 [Trachymyrmex septentrionalis]|uniref:deoxynucleotidyltransferase terminal-interacting protein 2 n=1 Tax=Trachymyrmex septentrionalis TaxID=34720 RepID=UPI00084F442F|nr:PREDICTED: deoxynucleotidyltransferase terminal-interacting protein 2 [Trachymyrmex septentrionalis]